MRSCIFAAVIALASPALAKGKGGGGGGGAASRAISELAGKYKWGMSHEECMKIIDEQIKAKFVELVKAEPDTYKQDVLRKQETEEMAKVRTDYVKFEGAKSGWDSSIVDKEFAHKNEESMLIRWEKDQRRFLFFWQDKLYKQYIAFDAQHPVFQGKTFDDFAKIIQGRYGKAEMKLAALKQKDDVTLDHLEWPSAGDYTLWAMDQSSFYGNFCLKLMQTSVLKRLEDARVQNSPKQPRGNALIDAVTQPETNKGDPNDDVVDRITGKHH
jgi:hypothetical protein